ncbi:MAG: type II secretion system protein, partial [Patescibacteria group bacterium]
MNNFSTQKNINIKNTKQGFTLIETLVAVAIFSLSIVSLMSVLGNGLSDIEYAKKKITATYLAQEGIEYFLNKRNAYMLFSSNPTDWNDFRFNFTGISNTKCSGSQPPSSNETGLCGFNIAIVNQTNAISVFKCAENPSNCHLYFNNGNYSTNPANGVDSGFIRTTWADTSVV